jgi:hypothetical protein
MRTAIAAAALLALLASVCGPMRADGPKPVQVCEFGGADFLSSGEKQNGRSVDELARELPKLLEACRKAVETEPRSARLHARYARVLAVAGDATGALKEARLGTDLGSPMAMVLLGVMVAETSSRRAEAHPPSPRMRQRGTAPVRKEALRPRNTGWALSTRRDTALRATRSKRRNGWARPWSRDIRKQSLH